MKDSPLVSIITPVFNRINLVGEAIDSVINQTYSRWEMIIVDDGSTDGSYEYIQGRAKQDPRIKVFKRNREPKGAPTCRNIGLEKTNGEFIIFLDSDDLLAPHCLQQRTQLFSQHAGHDFLVFPVQYFENKIGDRQEIFLRFFYQDYLTSFLLQSHWITLSPIWKKDALNFLKGFDETLICMQDGELHIRALLEKLKFQVFGDKKYIDSYLRASNSYERISNNVSDVKLEGKVQANLKLYNLLDQKEQLTPLRIRMLAAQFLNISWNYNLLGHSEKAFDTWQLAYEKGMVDKKSYFIGKSFIRLRSNSLIRNSRIGAGIAKRTYQIFLPRFMLKP